jgi:hypothetical protein
MEQHNGIIELGTIENTGDNADQISLLTVHFGHYPDYQQLIIWLPEYGRSGYGRYKIIKKATQTAVEQGEIGDKLNGSVQLLFDTIGWSEGIYRLEIDHPKGGQHVLNFQKYTEGYVSKPVQVVKKQLVIDKSPIVYRDGWGNVLPNEDLDRRAGANKQIASIFEKILTPKTEGSPRLEYEGSFRGGSVIYIEGTKRLSFWQEMGGGDCQMYINIPSEKNWEKQTNTPLSKRREILLFVASTVKREQAPVGDLRFERRQLHFIEKILRGVFFLKNRSFSNHPLLFSPY